LAQVRRIVWTRDTVSSGRSRVPDDRRICPACCAGRPRRLVTRLVLDDKLTGSSIVVFVVFVTWREAPFVA